MNKLVIILVIGFLFILSGCAVPPGQVRKHTTPGHVQHYTGCNPRSGKCKAKHIKPHHPGNREHSRY